MLIGYFAVQGAEPLGGARKDWKTESPLEIMQFQMFLLSGTAWTKDGTLQCQTFVQWREV